MLVSKRIAVIDDHPLFRAGVVQFLKSAGGFELVAEGANAQEAMNIARDLHPDVMLLDVSMPGSGLEAAREICKINPDIRIVMLTVCDMDDSVASCLELGVRGYLLKGISAEELIRVVRSVCEGESYITPTLAARLITQIRNKAKAKPAPTPSDLTMREEAVLNEVTRGLTNKEIARNLSLSEKTVKHYMTSIMQKLQVRSRLEAALFSRTKTH